jgi:hypothetical protein
VRYAIKSNNFLDVVAGSIDANDADCLCRDMVEKIFQPQKFYFAILINRICLRTKDCFRMVTYFAFTSISPDATGTPPPPAG